MPTLSAMFKLMDGYSSQINKIIDCTDRAMAKMLGASKAADKVNDSLVKTGKGASGAVPNILTFGTGLDSVTQKAQKTNSGLKKLIGTIASMAAVQKGMGTTDAYTNAQARLGMITGSDEERDALQMDVFAAANRSRGNYADMANATAKMRLLAGDNFTSNQEALGFTELLQKSLKVSGASQTEQDSAFLQLTQAMAAGKLQGDEFRSVMENAPMVADAIAKYTGRTKGELKELSSQGLITSDIIKNAMFMAADDINDKFGSMPMTFADVWGRIKNAGMKAFGGVFNRINDMLNSDMGQSALNSLTGAIYMAAEAADYLLDGTEFIGQHMDVLAPIVLGVAAGFMAYRLATGLAATGQMLLNSAMLASPVFWIVTGVIAGAVALYNLAAAIADTTGVASSGLGVIAGSINVVIQFFRNLFFLAVNVMLGIGTATMALGTNILVAFGNAISGTKAWFYDLLSTAVSVISRIAAELNKLPFVEFDYSGLISAADDYAAKSAVAAAEKNDYVSISDSFKSGMNAFDSFESGWAKDAFQAGASWGDGVTDKVTGFFSGSGKGFNLEGFSGGGGYNYEPYGGAGNPATVKGAGKNGSVNVTLEDEDVDYLRQLAERDYVARISQNTLAPNIHVEFTGDINQTADVDAVAGRITQIMRDEIETAPEGAY